MLFCNDKCTFPGWFIGYPLSTEWRFADLGSTLFLLLLMEDIESFLSNEAKVQVKSLVSKIKFRFVTSKVISIIT